MKKSKAKVIRMPVGFVEINKQRPLSNRMVATLLRACEFQLNGILFGQIELDGSFSPLVTRGLLKLEKSNRSPSTWYVTGEAFDILHNLGLFPKVSNQL
jgi:hypothetical protein